MTITPRSKPRLATSREPDTEDTKPSSNAPVTRLEQIRYALLCARTARDWLRQAGAHNAAGYVARAIKSVEGAERHAVNLDARRET